jgi:hypothetical protein
MRKEWKGKTPMKKITLETGSVIALFDVGDEMSYPIQSLPGCGEQNQHGWIARKAKEKTIVARLAPADALGAGFALPAMELAIRFGMIDNATYNEMRAALETILYEKDAQIHMLEKEIGKANDKIARMKRYSKRNK